MGGSVGWTAARAAKVLRAPTAADDKYSRGVVGFRTGSTRYPGAAVLGVQGAWRAGIGMVRYLGPDRPSDLVLQARPETVVADGRVTAWVVGSGTDAADRDPAETAAVAALLQGDVPVVADAGALDLVAAASCPLVVTPHAAEHRRLREVLGLRHDADPDAAVETAAALGAVVVLKGARTRIARPDGWLARVDGAPAWLATAGTGDVLAGALGAVLAAAVVDAEPTSKLLARAGATGAWLHARAAAVAAAAAGPGGGPITALDVAAALPTAVAEVLVLA